MKQLILTFLLGLLTLGVVAQTKPLQNPVLSYGLTMLHVPYVAHTLDQDEEEALTINCDEVDCTTFVEYALAMALTPVEDGDMSESLFAANLVKVRYRGGEIDGYASRLHYVTDWIDNGVALGFLTDVTAQHGTATQTLDIHYMSTHPQQYRQLSRSPQTVEAIRRVEQRLTGRTVKYLPKAQLTDEGPEWIHDGDIVAWVTSVSGLDVTHMGIAMRVDGKLSVLHASQSAGQVEVSKVTLSRLLDKNAQCLGIRVVRLAKQ